MLPQPNPYSAAHDRKSEVVESGTRPGVPLILVCAGLLTLILLAITAVGAFVLGGIIGQEQLYRNQASLQEAEIRVFISKHQERYSNISIERASDGWSYMMGTVNTQEDWDVLRAEMQRLFGEKLGDMMTMNVEVRERAFAVEPDTSSQ